MKAKVIATGEIVDVTWYEDNNTKKYVYVDQLGREWIGSALSFNIEQTTKPIDWEERRFELAKAAMQSIIPLDYKNESLNANEVADSAIYYADSIIAKLKEK